MSDKTDNYRPPTHDSCSHKQLKFQRKINYTAINCFNFHFFASVCGCLFVCLFVLRHLYYCSFFQLQIVLTKKRGFFYEYVKWRKQKPQENKKLHKTMHIWTVLVAFILNFQKFLFESNYMKVYNTSNFNSWIKHLNISFFTNIH